MWQLLSRCYGSITFSMRTVSPPRGKNSIFLCMNLRHTHSAICNFQISWRWKWLGKKCLRRLLRRRMIMKKKKKSEKHWVRSMKKHTELPAFLALILGSINKYILTYIHTNNDWMITLYEMFWRQSPVHWAPEHKSQGHPHPHPYPDQGLGEASPKRRCLKPGPEVMCGWTGIFLEPMLVGVRSSHSSMPSVNFQLISNFPA